MSRQSASVVASFSAKTLNYNREILKATKANQALLLSMNQLKKQATVTNTANETSGKSFMSLGIRISAAVILFKRLVAVMMEFGDEASRAEEIQQKFDVVFRSNLASVQDWADGLAEATNRNVTNIEKFAAQLQNTFVPLGFARDEAEELSIAMTELAMDLSSFNDIPVARVATDIQSALMGNVRAVRKYGVSASETSIAQTALVNGWIQEKSEIDAVVKAKAIERIMLKATVDSQGDLQRTMHQTANVRRAYNETIERSKGIIGQYINLALTPLRKKLQELAESWNAATEAHIAYVKYKETGDDRGIDKAIDYLETEMEYHQDILDIWTEEAVVRSGMGAERRAQALEDKKNASEELARLQKIYSLKMRQQDAEASRLRTQEEQDDEDERLAELALLRNSILNDLDKELAQNLELEKIANELGTEYNRTKEDSETVQRTLNKLVETGLTRESELISEVVGKYGERIESYVEEEKELARLEAQKEAIDDMAEAYNEHMDKKRDRNASAHAQVQQIMQDEADAEEERQQAIVDFYQSIPSLVAQSFDAIEALASALATRQMDLFTWENEQKESARDDAYDAEVARLEATIDDQSDLDNALEALSEEHADAEEAIAEALETKKRKMEYESAMISWKLGLLSATASGAQAIINGFNTQPFFPVGIAMGALASVLTGVQLGTVIASRPVKNFATGTNGFVVPEGYADDSFGIGLSSGERISVDTPNQQVDDNQSGSQVINFIMDRKVVGSVVTKGIRQRFIEVRAEDIR